MCRTFLILVKKKFKFYINIYVQEGKECLVRNDMDVNEHARLSNITLRYKFK
jgi:hypothetical protein